MAKPQFVEIDPHPLASFEPLLGDEYPLIEAAAERARERFGDLTVWHVSSTPRGGGVAEMLRSLLPYALGAGVDNRWVVVREPPEFFELTKDIHNLLHGDGGDPAPLGPEGKELYERCLAASARDLCPLLSEGDVVFLHDPQTAGLARAVKETGARVLWRCHVGVDVPNDRARRAWRFLTPYVTEADAYVFSRRAYVWESLDPALASVMAPCIDPFSPKNRDLEPPAVEEIVAAIGLGGAPPKRDPAFRRADDRPARLQRRAEIVQEAPLPQGAKMIAQISRWDRLKDPCGLLEAFHRHVDDADLHLVLAGPATAAVADDPEGVMVWRQVQDAWRELPGAERRRAHLVSLPMDDLDENATMVNALQRRADIVVQKSIAEGFGLTVAEAMWKSTPVIGTRVGGIQDQIVDGESGVLVDDPRDLVSLARAIVALAGDERRAATIGAAGRDRIRERYLAAGRLAEYAELVGRVVDGG